MLKPEELIRRKLKNSEQMVVRRIDSLESGKVPEDNIPKVHLGIGGNWQKVGLYKIALGECDDAIRDFRMSASWYHRGIRETRQCRKSLSDDFEGGVTLLKYLYSTILAVDEELLDQATEITFDTYKSHYQQFSTVHRYHLLNALAATIQQTGDQQAHLDELEVTIEKLPDDHQRFFRGLHRALSGIVQHDQTAFHNGIDQFLDWHDGQVDFENKTSAEDLVCKQVAALVVLARREGMDVHVDSEYVPECVSKLA